jgi:hypothetical protein
MLSVDKSCKVPYDVFGVKKTKKYNRRVTSIQVIKYISYSDDDYCDNINNNFKDFETHYDPRDYDTLGDLP